VHSDKHSCEQLWSSSQSPSFSWSRDPSNHWRLVAPITLRYALLLLPKAIQEYRQKHKIEIEDGPEILLKESAEEKTPENVEQKSNSKTDGEAASNGGENSRTIPSKDEGDAKCDDTDMKDSENQKEPVSKTSENLKSTDVQNVQTQSKDDNEDNKDVETLESAEAKVAVKTEDVDMKDSEVSKDVTMTDVAANSPPKSIDEVKKEGAEDDKSEKQDSSMDQEKDNEKQPNDAKDSPNQEPSDQPVEKESQTLSSSVANADGKSEKNAATASEEKITDSEEKKDCGNKKNTDQADISKEETIESKLDQTCEKKSASDNSTGNQNGAGTKPDVNGMKSIASSENGEVPKASSTLSMQERSGKFAAMAKKRGISGEEKNEASGKDFKEKSKNGKASEAAPVIYVLDSKGRRVKVIDDDTEEMDCEFLNNRQAFLNLCQGNHYQFDHLRRAKHSSMMVLWHLHNRDAPKFVQQCTTCSREILQGYRFHCPICADFDQCQDCVQNPNIPRHPHQLKPIAVAGQQTELTEAQRKERQRSLQLHMTLLQHAATCNSPKCPSANCTKMKGLLKHGAQCKIKATGGCNVCKRIWALLQIHARQCKSSQCPVPNCMAIRERVRQLKKQQQAMDDRRRQEMNRVYSGAR